MWSAEPLRLTVRRGDIQGAVCSGEHDRDALETERRHEGDGQATRELLAGRGHLAVLDRFADQPEVARDLLEIDDPLELTVEVVRQVVQEEMGREVVILEP